LKAELKLQPYVWGEGVLFSMEWSASCLRENDQNNIFIAIHEQSAINYSLGIYFHSGSVCLFSRFFAFWPADIFNNHLAHKIFTIVNSFYKI